MSDILDKTRRALVTYITAGAVGTANIYDAKGSGDKALPNVECDAEESREEPMGTGNFWVLASVTVKFVAAVDADGVSPKAPGDLLTANVIGLLEIDNDSLRTALSGQIASFTVIGFGEEKSIEQLVEGDVWKTVWKRMIYCAGF